MLGFISLTYFAAVKKTNVPGKDIANIHPDASWCWCQYQNIKVLLLWPATARAPCSALGPHKVGHWLAPL